MSGDTGRLKQGFPGSNMAVGDLMWFYRECGFPECAYES